MPLKINTLDTNLIAVSGKIGSGKDTITQIIQFLTCEDEEIRESFLENPEKALKCYDGVVGFNTKYVNKKFAKNLKKTLSILLGVRISKFEDKDYVNTELDSSWWYYEGESGIISYQDINKGDVSDLKLVKPTPRNLMQTVGNTAGRKFIHPDVWINSMFNLDEEKNKANAWLISDLRYPNEFNAITERNGLTIRVVRYLSLSDWLKTYHIDCDVLGMGEYIDVVISDLDFLKFLKEYDSEYVGEILETINNESETSLDEFDTFDEVINNDGSLTELVDKVQDILTKHEVISKNDVIVNE